VKRGEKKKQRKALKKRTSRRQARQKARAAQPSSTATFHIRHARSYPIDSCWVQGDWEEGGLAVIVVARSQPDGNIVFGNYLVDFYCLGLKDTYNDANVPPGEFRRDHLPKMYRSTEPPVEIAPALAHEIIYGAIEYAGQFGFRPHRDFRRSRDILDPPDLHPRSGTVEFGHDGMPLYIQGPYDHAEAIVRRLMRTAGEGNFHYLMQVPGPQSGWADDHD
jgi:hypothetical protein